MMTSRFTGKCVRLAVAVVLGLVVVPGSVMANDLCGVTVFANVTLDHDLACAGDGLIVGADGIRINLDGHTIAGSGVGIGITVRGRQDVTVSGGTVRGFVTGVMVAASTGVVIKGNRFTQNREAVFLSASSGNVIKENLAWQNQLRGLMLRPNSSGVLSTQNLVVENTLSDNPSGILLFGQPGNIFKENLISGSTVAGFDLTGGGASGNQMKENVLTSNAAAIKFGPGWTGNRFVENAIQLNTCGVQGPADGNTFKENVFTGNTLTSCP